MASGGEAIKARREALGITQTELAARAGVSRQLLGALESGRHVPRVDAAMGLARALGVTTETLFDTGSEVIDVRSGLVPSNGTVVRVGHVGDRIVTAPVRWAVADGVVEEGALTPFAPGTPGLVVAGCEPGLETLEGLLRRHGSGALAVNCSTSEAIEILAAGRAHAAVVHGSGNEGFPEPARSDGPDDLTRYRLGGWRVGLAGPLDADRAWFAAALRGSSAVIQREHGAAVQAAFERLVGTNVPGPIVSSHLEAVQLMHATGLAAVTIEPAAIAHGAQFRPLEIHHIEMWVARRWSTDRAVDSALDVLVGTNFLRQLRAVGGYDLDGFGSRVA